MSATAFGLDPSGYSGGRSVLARLDVVGDTINATIFEIDVLKAKIKGDALIDDIAEAEAQLLHECLCIGPLAIDIPIDLQGLPNVTNPKYVWQLTMRPVDYALGAMPPLADRIGAPVARMQNVLRRLKCLPPTPYGPPIETYPAASLKLMGLPSTGYKNSEAARRDGCWADQEQGEAKRSTLPLILTKLSVEAVDPIRDDDLDAILCGLSMIGSVGRMAGKELEAMISDQLRKKGVRALPTGQVVPTGFALVTKREFSRIVVRRRHLSSPKGLIEGAAA